MIEAHEYEVDISVTGLATGTLTSPTDGLPELAVSSPPEFGGPVGVWSPEHLFVAALASCLMTTFRSMASRSNVEIVEYSDTATGLLQRGADGLYRIERVTLRPLVVVADDSQKRRAERLLEKAEKVCLISRSVSSAVRLEGRVLAR